MFWLYTALQYRSSMSSKFLVFYTFGGLSSRLAASLFLFFVSTTLSFSYVNCPSLMSSWLLIIFVTLEDFPSRFLKCSFHMCIRFSWSVDFNLALEMVFLLHTSFTLCHTIRDCLSSTEILILLIGSYMYSIYSFKYVLVSSVCAF